MCREYFDIHDAIKRGKELHPTGSSTSLEASRRFPIISCNNLSSNVLRECNKRQVICPLAAVSPRHSESELLDKFSRLFQVNNSVTIAFLAGQLHKPRNKIEHHEYVYQIRTQGTSWTSRTQAASATPLRQQTATFYCLLGTSTLFEREKRRVEGKGTRSAMLDRVRALLRCY